MGIDRETLKDWINGEYAQLKRVGGLFGGPEALEQIGTIRGLMMVANRVLGPVDASKMLDEVKVANPS